MTMLLQRNFLHKIAHTRVITETCSSGLVATDYSAVCGLGTP